MGHMLVIQVLSQQRHLYGAQILYQSLATVELEQTFFQFIESNLLLSTSVQLLVLLQQEVERSRNSSIGRAMLPEKSNSSKDACDFPDYSKGRGL